MRAPWRSRRGLVVTTGAFALAARAAYWGLATPERVLASDAFQYHFVATNLAEGRGYADIYPQLALHPTAFRPPLYPGLLGAVYGVLWPTPGIGRAVNVVLGVAVVVVLVLLVDRHLGRRSALAAGIVASLYPNFLANDTYVLSEPLASLLILGVIGWALEERWIPAAVAAGLLVLTRPSAPYLVLLFVLYVLLRVGWRRAALVGVVVVAVVSPWVVRNWIRLGSPVLVTSNGFNYAAVYSPAADESGGFVDARLHPAFAESRWDQFDEVRWDRNLRALAVDHVRDDPSLVPEVVARNSGAYLEITPERNEVAERLDGRSRRVRAASYWLLWPLVVVGVYGLVRRRRHPLVVLSMAVGGLFCMGSLLFVTSPRLRTPTELGLIVAASALVAARPGDPDRDQGVSST